jgi:hypothetical protein
LQATLRALGPRVIDKRTSIGKVLAAWKGALMNDLGGADALDHPPAGACVGMQSAVSGGVVEYFRHPGRGRRGCRPGGARSRRERG